MLTHRHRSCGMASQAAKRAQTTRRASCRRNAKPICNGHGVCGAHVPHHGSPIVVWTHSNDRVATHTTYQSISYEMGRYTS
jgi:hypothetical protein